MVPAPPLSSTHRLSPGASTALTVAGVAGAGLLGGLIWAAVTGRRLVIAFKAGVPYPLLVKDVGNGAYLRSDAAQAFLWMADEARAAGIPLAAGSAFRSMAEQSYLWSLSVTGKYKDKTGKNVPVAFPGTSNHQQAVTVDITDGVQRGFDRDLWYASALFKWMLAHAPKFGWSWAEGKKINEPWHWNYVGVGA